MIQNALTLSFSRAQAARNRAVYQGVFAAILITETALGVGALVAPALLAFCLSAPESNLTMWRPWGAALIVIVCLYIPGYLDPVYARWANIVGIVARGFTAILFLFIGSGFLWLASLYVVFTLVLATAYWRLLRAELMTRP